MINQESVEDALEFIRVNANHLAQAKADRVYLEQFRKSKKALLFADAPDVMGSGEDSRRATIADRANHFLMEIEAIKRKWRKERYDRILKRAFPAFLYGHKLILPDDLK